MWKEYDDLAKVIIVIIAITPILGCSTLGVSYSHTSHPLAGPPFGPQTDEDYLDTIDIFARRETDRWFIESSVGYKLTPDGGFYGPDLVFNSRIGVNLYRKER